MVWLSPGGAFPDPSRADARGILAVGGDYAPERLLAAYRRGIFPWSSVGDPIVWWSPDPRYVLFPDELVVQRSMRPYLNQRRFRVTYDTHFREVIVACAHSPRGGEQVGTWITADLARGYAALHDRGYAHSVEVWTEDGELAGGLYGVAIGRVFCGESMFTRVSNASKYAFIHLVKNLRRRGYWLVDCQMPTAHLAGLGAQSIPRDEFVALLTRNDAEPTDVGPWTDLMNDDALEDKLPSAPQR